MAKIVIIGGGAAGMTAAIAAAWADPSHEILILEIIIYRKRSL